MKKKGLWFALGYAMLLVAFTAYVLMDTFTITRVYTKVEVPVSTKPTRPITPSTPNNPDLPNSPTSDQTTTEPTITDDEPIITESSYYDGYISINLTEYREYNTAIYVADIQISDPEYLKTAFAKDSYGRNIKEKTSEMAKSHNAILAINGDYYGSREKGYVLRNGQLFREKGSSSREDLVIWPYGSFEIISEKTTTAKSLLSAGAWQVLSFGPALVQKGQISVDVDEEVGQATYSNPRTAIAIIEEGHYLMVVSDGRTDRSDGLTLYQLAGFLQSLGAETAYNLDGGGSSTMWFNGKIINEPVNHGSTVSERSVSDIVYIGY